MTSEPRLRASEAAPLLHALVARAAASANVRALAIKGPALALQGLRVERTSADVDVMISPSEMDDFLDKMFAIGWHNSPTRTAPRVVPSHSLDLVHERWPISIDVHHQFPGFLADPTSVFEVLWTRRATLQMAEVPVPVADPCSQAALVALHLLRDPWFASTSELLTDLRVRTLDVLSHDDLEELAHLAAMTGAAMTMAPFLEALGIEAPQDRTAEKPTRLAQWEMRTRQEFMTAPWLLELKQEPMWHWPATIHRAIAMPEWQVRRKYGDPRDPDEAIWRLRLRRARNLALGSYITALRRRGSSSPHK